MPSSPTPESTRLLNAKLRTLSKKRKSDPTGTWPIVKRLIQSLRKRLSNLSSDIRRLLLVTRVFDKRYSVQNVAIAAPSPGDWGFLSSEQQLARFTEWLMNEINGTIITPDDPWWDAYVREGYEKGFRDAHEFAMRHGVGGISLEDGFQLPGFSSDADIRLALSMPVHQDKLNLIASRLFNELEGMTDDMANRLARTLVDGLIAGDGPRDIARILADEIGISRTRAETIARTEIIRAHAEGQLDSLSRLGITEFQLLAEWSTAGDDRVCPRCYDRQGLVLSLQEARGAIPLHPRCRCTWIPANVGSQGVLPPVIGRR